MKLGILKEPNYEQRVSLLDEGVLEAIKLKAEVLVEKGAGLSSFVSDEQYETAGAKVVSRAEIFEQSDIILQINAPTDEDLNSLKQGKIIMSMLSPMGNTTLINSLKLQVLVWTLFHVLHELKRWMYSHQWHQLQDIKLY